MCEHRHPLSSYYPFKVIMKKKSCWIVWFFNQSVVSVLLVKGGKKHAGFCCSTSYQRHYRDALKCTTLTTVHRLFFFISASVTLLCLASNYIQQQWKRSRWHPWPVSIVNVIVSRRSGDRITQVIKVLNTNIHCRLFRFPCPSHFCR